MPSVRLTGITTVVLEFCNSSMKLHVAAQTKHHLKMFFYNELCQKLPYFYSGHGIETYHYIAFQDLCLES